MSKQSTTQVTTTAIEPNHVCDNFKPIVPTEYQEHTLDRPFCTDSTCPCQDDPNAIAQVNEWYQGGLISAEDATRIMKGNAV